MNKRNVIIASAGIALFATSALGGYYATQPHHESASPKVVQHVDKTEASKSSKSEVKPVKKVAAKPKIEAKAKATAKTKVETEKPAAKVAKNTSEQTQPVDVETPKVATPVKQETPAAPTKQETPATPVETPTTPVATPVATSVSFAGASAYATTQYSHTTATHSEGATYAVNASPVTVSGNTLSGSVVRTGVGLEKGSIVLNYSLNFDGQGRYVSGNVTSSGYVTPYINLVVGQVYSGTVADAIVTSTGHAGSGSLLYPVRVALNL